MAWRRSLLILAMCAVPALATADEPKATRRDDPGARPPPADFDRAGPEEVGIDKAALERLRERAEDADSDAVVIVKDGRLVADWDFGRAPGPIEAMSATKSIVNLAIGRLIDQGKLKGLDQPVHVWYPEWNQGRKKLVTVRHLLNHTSGLQCFPITKEIYDSPDFVQFALAAEMSTDPGSTFFYNNKAVNLLAGLVQRVSGEKMHDYIGREIFGPMGIKDFSWSLDRAGNPHGMAGLQIGAVDLAKVGQMMLDGGTWKGRRIVSEGWVRQSVEPGQSLEPTCGLLWWLEAGPRRFAVDDAVVKHFKDRGMTARSLGRLEALKGKPIEPEAFWAALGPIVREDEILRTKLGELNRDLPRPKVVPSGPVKGYSAKGYLGQFLFVMPSRRIVAVRQRRFREGTNAEDPRTTFDAFVELVASLVPGEPRR